MTAKLWWRCWSRASSNPPDSRDPGHIEWYRCILAQSANRSGIALRGAISHLSTLGKHPSGLRPGMCAVESRFVLTRGLWKTDGHGSRVHRQQNVLKVRNRVSVLPQRRQHGQHVRRQSVGGYLRLQRQGVVGGDRGPRKRVGFKLSHQIGSQNRFLIKKRLCQLELPLDRGIHLRRIPERIARKGCSLRPDSAKS